MMFEYDKLKSKGNKEKHGIDFTEAQQLWKDTERIEIPTKFLDEPRYVLIGKINNKHWAAVFTYRNNKVRLISVRRARKNEKEIYES
ncbi:BrnT family toxin [candidate division KSB1 bacterium]|nr:BrnT family toxin [candidate division KSB1 bacterium]